MKLIKNPCEDIILDLTNNCRKNIRITSPYVKLNPVKKILNTKSIDTKLKLIMAFKLENFYRSASDLEALRLILKKRGKIKNYHQLHAKTYIFDSNYAIITSANLTQGGLINNYEYGVLIENRSLVKKIIDDFDLVFKSVLTNKIRLTEINKADKIIQNIPKEKRIKFPKIETDEAIDEKEIYTGGVDTILNSLSGWRKDTFKCLLKIKNDNFKLKDVYEFERYLTKLYPGNSRIKDKLRQQLQELRDIGLIKFVKRGEYQKLWKV